MVGILAHFFSLRIRWEGDKSNPPQKSTLTVKALATQLLLLVLQPLFSIGDDKQNEFTRKCFDLTSGEDKMADAL